MHSNNTTPLQIKLDQTHNHKFAKVLSYAKTFDL
jgi:hypothetical protein